jgi:cyanophycin synthetase
VYHGKREIWSESCRRRGNRLRFFGTQAATVGAAGGGFRAAGRKERMVEQAGNAGASPDHRVLRGRARDGLDIWWSCPVFWMGETVVVKPEKGNQGKGVSVRLSEAQEVVDAFHFAKKYDDSIIVEQHIQGKDYRVLVVGDQVVAAARKIPAHVIGDGIHTILELVEDVNQKEIRGDGHEKPLTKIKIDDVALALLKKQGYSVNSIPHKDKWIYLKENSNLSTGGEAIDCTDHIHPTNREIAIRAARAIGLNIAGIDIICEDISIPIEKGSGAIIEINAAPGIRMHLYPSVGKPRKVADHILDALYPSRSKHSVPIISITGTNGKTTTARMISHILRVHGLNVGLTTTGGVYINDKCIMKGDTTGPSSAQAVLTDRSIDVAVLETARGGIIRSGLGYDLSDVGILTNISEDHLGVDDINSLEDLLHVKSLVLEAIKNTGYAILNADDPMVVQAEKKVRCNSIYFSKQDDNFTIHKHLAKGGIAVFVKNGYITIATGDSLIQSLSILQIPATMAGKLVHNIENSLAAVSAAYALRIPIATIEKAIGTFYTDELQNPGRFNVFNIRDFRVIVDYGHNIAGYKYVLDAVKKMGASRLIGIIGVPGDRSDESIRDIGQIAGQVFDYIYIKEDLDLRGRREGEVFHLLHQGIIKTGFGKNRVEYIRYETQALSKAIATARSGDLIVIFYEKLQPVLDLIKNITLNLERENNLTAKTAFFESG